MDRETFFTEVLGIRSKALLDELCKVSIIETFEKGEFIVREETLPAQLYILIEGICRGFFTNDNGREITDCFHHKLGEVLMGSFDLKEPTILNVVAETDVKVISLSMVSLVNMLQEYVELVYVYNQMLSNALSRHVGIKLALYKHDAKGKYMWFLKNYPGLIDIVKQRHVASFLNITPESLSRVRSKIKQYSGGGELLIDILIWEI